MANECLDSQLREGIPGVICKLDIEKAFDHVNWDFLFYMLKRCSFGARWCSWIRHCVSTPCFSILVNGTPAGFSTQFVWIETGDPLSPFLIVIVMEALGQMVEAAVRGGFLFGFSVGNDLNGSITLSHLLFADDTIIFVMQTVAISKP